MVNKWRRMKGKLKIAFVSKVFMCLNGYLDCGTSPNEIRKLPNNYIDLNKNKYLNICNNTLQPRINTHNLIYLCSNFILIDLL